MVEINGSVELGSDMFNLGVIAIESAGLDDEIFP